MLFSSVPVVALIPVIARLLGYDTSTVLAIVVIITFFPSFVFASSGLRSPPPGSEDLFRVLGACAWLPFLPMAPIQVLTNNLLYDLSQSALPLDRVKRTGQVLQQIHRFHSGRIRQSHEKINMADLVEGVRLPHHPLLQPLLEHPRRVDILTHSASPLHIRRAHARRTPGRS